jgi:retron-type reverse transcriptase
VDELLKSGYHWVVDADLKGYFDSIPQEGLMEGIKEKIADGRRRHWRICVGGTPAFCPQSLKTSQS